MAIPMPPAPDSDDEPEPPPVAIASALPSPVREDPSPALPAPAPARSDEPPVRWGPLPTVRPEPVPAPRAEPSSTVRPDAPPPLRPGTVVVATAPAPVVPDDFATRANAWIAEQLPRLAQRSERLVLRVLHAAAQAEETGDEDDVLQAARAMHLSGPGGAWPTAAAAGLDARRLHEAAAAAFWDARNAHQALALQLRAFGANPLDADVAGNLAFYYLKQRPAAAESARRLALYALALPDSPHAAGRLEDWTTLAIASALVGRERDARNAFFVTLALSPSLDRQCRAAASAYATHGTPLRAPTEAMLARIRTWGRSGESPFCRWPPNWWVGVRAP